MFTPAVGDACPSSVVLKGKEKKVLPTKSEAKDTFPIIHLYFPLDIIVYIVLIEDCMDHFYKIHTAKQSSKTELAYHNFMCMPMNIRWHCALKGNSTTGSRVLNQQVSFFLLVLI